MSIPGVQYVLHAGCMNVVDALHARPRRRELYTVIQWRCSHLDGNAGCMQAALPWYAACIRSYANCIYDRVQAACIRSANTTLHSIENSICLAVLRKLLEILTTVEFS